jgi:hypothetical protein
VERQKVVSFQNNLPPRSQSSPRILGVLGVLGGKSSLVLLYFGENNDQRV